MFEFKDFKQQATELTKWLISIPSITGTLGEDNAVKAVFDTLSGYSYFRHHREYLHYIPHLDQKNHSLLALVKVDEETRDTLAVLCQTDTSGNDDYGVLKPLAFKSDELKDKLKGAVAQDREKSLQLTYSNNIYGLGSFESKAVTGCLLTLLREVSDKLYELPFNLLLICTSNSINGHQGMRECLPYIHEIMREHRLNLKLALGFHPEDSSYSNNEFNLYTANMGLAEPCFYILGHGAVAQNAYSGFSPTLVAAKIIQKVELNTQLAAQLSKTAMVPSFKHMGFKSTRSPNTPDAVQLCFNLPFVNLNLLDIIEVLKEAAAEALEETALDLENRESVYVAGQGGSFTPQSRDAEVVSYADLFYRASRHYRGDLSSAIEGLLQKCRQEGYTRSQMARAVIERLNDLARLPRPSVVIYLGSDFIPQQQIRRNNSDDREIYIRLSKAVDEFNNSFVQQITFKELTGPSDCCFIRPVGIDQALKALQIECPIMVNSFFNLGAPAVTLSVKGADLYQPTEHVSTEMFDIIPGFIFCLFENFKTVDEDIKNMMRAEDDLGELDQHDEQSGRDDS